MCHVPSLPVDETMNTKADHHLMCHVRVEACTVHTRFHGLCQSMTYQVRLLRNDITLMYVCAMGNLLSSV